MLLKSLRIMLLFVLVLATGTPRVLAAEREISRSAVEIYINKDGTVTILETLENESSAEQVPLRYNFLPAQSTRMTDISLTQGDTTLMEVVGRTDLTYGTFVSDPEQMDLYYLPIPGDPRPVQLSYKLWDVINRYIDVADFSFRWANSGHTSSQNSSIYIYLPDLTDPAAIQAWLRGADAVIEITDGQTVSIRNLHNEESLISIRAIFPSSILLGDLHPLSAGEQIIEEETTRTELEQKKDRQQYFRIIMTLGYFGLLQPLVLSLWLFFYLKLKRHRTRADSHIYKFRPLPPFERTPAEIPWLIGSKKSKNPGPLMIATLFDLCRRGYLNFEEELLMSSGLSTSTLTTQLFLHETIDPQAVRRLSPPEEQFLPLLFENNDSSKISFDELLTLIHERKGKFENWVKEARTYSARKIALSRERDPDILRLWAAAGLALFLGSPLVILAVFLLPLIPPRPAEYESETHAWQLFAEGLDELIRMTNPPADLNLGWEKYLAYAIVLNKTEGITMHLPAILAASVSLPSWYKRAGEIGFNTTSISTFGSTLKTIMNRLVEALR